MTGATPRPWRPLEGMRVVDLTQMVPGGMATLLLADLGATVIKVERPGGDAMRELAPRVGGDSSAQHAYVDRGKKSVTADLKHEEGRRVVHELVAGADALIESFRPGVADRLGVGFSRLSEVTPALVYVSLSGFGQTGPRSGTAGHDLNFVGYANLVGRDVPKALLADVPGGMLAALAIAAGIVQARSSGRGSHIDLSLADAALVMSGVQIAEELASTALGQSIDSPITGGAPNYGVYATADGRMLAVAALETKFWVQLCALLDRPEWQARRSDPTLVTELETLFLQHDLQHWVDLLSGENTCVTPVLDYDELAADPQVRQRGSLREVATAAGPLWQVSSPFIEMGYTS